MPADDAKVLRDRIRDADTLCLHAERKIIIFGKQTEPPIVWIR